MVWWRLVHLQTQLNKIHKHNTHFQLNFWFQEIVGKIQEISAHLWQLYSTQWKAWSMMTYSTFVRLPLITFSPLTIPIHKLFGQRYSNLVVYGFSRLTKEFDYGTNDKYLKATCAYHTCVYMHLYVHTYLSQWLLLAKLVVHWHMVIIHHFPFGSQHDSIRHVQLREGEERGGVQCNFNLSHI